MATITTAIKIQDAMTPAFHSMNNALNIVLNSFETLQNTTHKAVDTAGEKSINISTNITLVKNKSIEDIEELIKNEISKYLLELKKTWEDSDNIIVRISQIETRILNIDGILDISNTKINNTSSNIGISSNEIPTIGTVEVTNENKVFISYTVNSIKGMIVTINGIAITKGTEGQL